MSKLSSIQEEIKIPRWIKTTNLNKLVLHGFADASDKAYAAVVYLVINWVVIIVIAKRKVNPIKNRTTITKLELCAAHLLAKLMSRIQKTIERETSIFAWSDSKIVLAWIQNNNNKEKFIKTRTTEILRVLPNAANGSM